MPPSSKAPSTNAAARQAITAKLVGKDSRGRALSIVAPTWSAATSATSDRIESALSKQANQCS